MSDRYPCPCCGHCVLDDMPGSYEICPVCFWDDDAVQFRWPTTRVSLIEAQRNYQEFSACDQHGRKHVQQLDTEANKSSDAHANRAATRHPRPGQLNQSACLLLACTFTLHIFEQSTSEVNEGVSVLIRPTGRALVGDGTLLPFGEFPHSGDEPGG